jgi:hypothetical protein
VVFLLMWLLFCFYFFTGSFSAFYVKKWGGSMLEHCRKSENFDLPKEFQACVR